jgi:hypothetical protein
MMMNDCVMQALDNVLAYEIDDDALADAIGAELCHLAQLEQDQRGTLEVDGTLH